MTRAQLIEDVDKANTVYVVTDISPGNPIRVPVDPDILKEIVVVEGQILGDRLTVAKEIALDDEGQEDASLGYDLVIGQQEDENNDDYVVDGPHTLSRADAEAITAHFREIAVTPMPAPSTNPDVLDKFIHRAATMERNMARRIVSLGRLLPQHAGLASWTTKRLVADGFALWRAAFVAARRDVRIRTHVHDMSPEADRLDLLALAIANAIPGITIARVFELCT